MNLYGRVRTMRFNTLFYHKTDKRQKLSDPNHDNSEILEKSVDMSDPGAKDDPEFDPTDRDLEHHREQNRRDLPRLGNNSNIPSLLKIELMIFVVWIKRNVSCC